MRRAPRGWPGGAHQVLRERFVASIATSASAIASLGGVVRQIDLDLRRQTCDAASSGMNRWREGIRRRRSAGLRVAGVAARTPWKSDATRTRCASLVAEDLLARAGQLVAVELLKKTDTEELDTSNARRGRADAELGARVAIEPDSAIEEVVQVVRMYFREHEQGGEITPAARSWIMGSCG